MVTRALPPSLKTGLGRREPSGGDEAQTSLETGRAARDGKCYVSQSQEGSFEKRNRKDRLHEDHLAHCIWLWSLLTLDQHMNTALQGLTRVTVG